MDFTKFRQAVAVIQMTAVIDDDPAIAQTLCPDLQPETVLAILRLREKDDDLVHLPDLEYFASHYKLDAKAPFKQLKMNCRNICGAQGQIVDTHTWKDVCVCSQLFKDFPYLSDYFVEQ